MISEFGADAVLGMGGFTSLAPLIAGRRHGAKVFIHESNAFPGKANRLAARCADSVLLGLSACKRYFPGQDVEVVGTPLRRVMCRAHDKRAALDHFGLKEGKKTLLVMGGSQGARGINQAVTGGLDTISGLGMQVIHLTGPADFKAIQADYMDALLPHAVLAFCHEMHLAYTAADIAIARSGASSLAELSAFSLPTILVPFPYAADDHQTFNARVYKNCGAAKILKEEDIQTRSLGMLLDELTENNGAALKDMAGAMDGMAIRNAAENICRSMEVRCR